MTLQCLRDCEMLGIVTQAALFWNWLLGCERKVLGSGCGCIVGWGQGDATNCGNSQVQKHGAVWHGSRRGRSECVAHDALDDLQ
jgi:hypothetical protein